MMEWWKTLSDRERLMLGGGGLLLVLGTLYFILWASFFSRLADLRLSVPEKRAELAWMRGAAVDVARLRPIGKRGAANVAGGSVMAVIDQTAKQEKLAGKLKRIEPDGENGAKVWVDEAPFDDIMRWLYLLESKHTIRATAFSAESLAGAGFVKARLTLVGQ
jgi:general secretion pathway protein M